MEIATHTDQNGSITEQITYLEPDWYHSVYGVTTAIDEREAKRLLLLWGNDAEEVRRLIDYAHAGPDDLTV